MQLISLLQKRCKEIGFDICEPFKISAYNRILTKTPLAYKPPNELAVIIGNTKTFWSSFISWLSSLSSVPQNPVDTYTRQSLTQIFSSSPFSELNYRFYWSWSLPRNVDYVHVQTAGHVAGIAYYDREVLWSVSPTWGTWFVFRSVVVLDLPWNSDFPEKIAIPVLTEEEKQQMLKLTEIAKNEGWTNSDTLLKVRDVCKVGREHRYDLEQLSYFYSSTEARRAFLEKIISRQTVK
eukprot:TRINITY_DN1272_c0_g1_i1.p1 TRINITY_DN1272_c0_g1~~TRINITY_DN1272_c0_g1_i1.p1  ORF type:complete len:236 (+),score=36.78 TRINITY_DN1272_c0_g1_i1:82-789(+)